MIRVIIFVLLFSFVINDNNLYSQKKSKAKQEVISNSVSDEIVAKVGDELIKFSELDKAFQKNVNRKDTRLKNLPIDSVMDFLKLYINYRLKVNDAYHRKIDKDSSVITEINQNRRLLAESYFYDKRIVEPNVKKIMKYREKELQIAIVLFSLPGNINPDTLPTYLRAKNAFNLLKSGKFKFEELARDSSDDIDSKTKGGLISSYITGGRVQRPIEEAIYSLKPGEIYNDIVGTRYGYFILKLIKSEPRIKVKCSHILLSLENANDTLSISKKADSLISIIKKGQDFAELAKLHSQDPTSAIRGGELTGWYSRSTGFDNIGKNLMPAFEEALFNLKDGQISGKVYTDYGIHIIRRDSSKLADVESEKEEIKRAYKRLYYEEDKKQLLESYKKQFGFKINDNILNEFIALLDTNRTNLDSMAFARITPSLENKELFKINQKSYLVKDIIAKSKSKGEFRGLGLNYEGVRKAIDKIVDPIVFDLASENLDKEYEDFASLLREFKDGILLFKVETNEVFDKLKFDTLAARDFWQKNKSKYKTLPIYNLTEIFVLDDTTANNIYYRALKGEDFEKLAEANTQRSGFREKKGNWNKVSIKDNKLAQYANEKSAKVGDILPPFENEKGYSIIKINSFEPIREKEFLEAIPDLAPEFQDMMQKKLQEKWINSIKERVQVQIFEDKLKKILNN